MRENKCADCRWWAWEKLCSHDLSRPGSNEHSVCACSVNAHRCFFNPVAVDKMGSCRACGHFAAREPEKQEAEVVGTGAFPGEAIAGNVAAKSPLAERGFRLIDKELWEKEIAPKPLTKPPTSTVEEKIAELQKAAWEDAKIPGKAPFANGILCAAGIISATISEQPPKAKRWMVDVAKPTYPGDTCKILTCATCTLNGKCSAHSGSQYFEKGRLRNCPAVEVECEDDKV